MSSCKVEMNGHAHVNGNSNGTDTNGIGRVHDHSKLTLKDQTRAQKVSSILSCLQLDHAMLDRVADVFLAELEAGLADRPSSLQMENTYVPEMPDGTEEGIVLALDLGGTNFRVLFLELGKGKELIREQVRQYHISDALRLGPGVDLFEFLADCVLDFLKSEGLEHMELPLGFTFSFPMKQHSISSGELITWTKSFKCGGMEGVDVSALLQSALMKRGLKVKLRALLNDTTGTLVTGAWDRSDVAIGVILGTGSNGCYLERASRVSHWEVPGSRDGDVAIDIEWGAFGDDGCLDFIKTDMDRLVDQRSLLTGSFTFEKYLGGKYLGGLLQAALELLHSKGLFSRKPLPDALHTLHLSMFEQESLEGAMGDCDGSSRTIQALTEICGGEVSRDDALVAQYACELISTRAAQLVAVCIAVLLKRIDREHVAVAMDGSVYKKHPRIKNLIIQYISIMAPGHSFELTSADDGSGKGSALTAAVADRLAKHK